MKQSCETCLARQPLLSFSSLTGSSLMLSTPWCVGTVRPVSSSLSAKKTPRTDGVRFSCDKRFLGQTRPPLFSSTRETRPCGFVWRVLPAVTRLASFEQHRPRREDDGIQHENDGLPGSQASPRCRAPFGSRSRRTRKVARRCSPSLPSSIVEMTSTATIGSRVPRLFSSGALPTPK